MKNNYLIYTLFIIVYLASCNNQSVVTVENFDDCIYDKLRLERPIVKSLYERKKTIIIESLLAKKIKDEYVLVFANFSTNSSSDPSCKVYSQEDIDVLKNEIPVIPFNFNKNKEYKNKSIYSEITLKLTFYKKNDRIKLFNCEVIADYQGITIDL